MNGMEQVQRWIDTHPRSTAWLLMWALIIYEMYAAERMGAPGVW